MLKLGVHAGSCIAVTTGNSLDYFGATVNIAARLEHQYRGGEVIVSETIAKDAETEAALADRMLLEETAMLRGVSAPVRFGSPKREAAEDFAMPPTPNSGPL